MFEMLILKVTAKHHSPWLFYLGVIRILQNTEVVTKRLFLKISQDSQKVARTIVSF